MKKMKLVIAALAVLAVCAGLTQVAPAEEVQTRGPHKGNMARECIAGKQMNADSHLAKMATCLNLTEDQKAKIKPLLEENFKAKQAVRADKNLTRDQRRAKMKELRVTLHDQLKPLLTTEQNSKVANMWTAPGHHWKGKKGYMKARHHGKNFRMDPTKHLARMTACLGLSADQQAKIKLILEENFKEKQALRADTTLTRDQRRTKMKELRVQMHEKVKPLLTPDQLKQYGARKGPAAKQPKCGNCPLPK
ncbi:MAG: hypothetical protein EHM79_15730 [Geobacter sp.]|nr:MAG: hypothetical protein EHM79_15730 [Geobacter sp.]